MNKTILVIRYRYLFLKKQPLKKCLETDILLDTADQIRMIMPSYNILYITHDLIHCFMRKPKQCLWTTLVLIKYALRCIENPCYEFMAGSEGIERKCQGKAG